MEGFSYFGALFMAELMEAVVENNLLAAAELSEAAQLATACRNVFTDCLFAAGSVKPMEGPLAECHQVVQTTYEWFVTVMGQMCGQA